MFDTWLIDSKHNHACSVYEVIEPFPQEIRERLTEMREIDLQIQSKCVPVCVCVFVFFADIGQVYLNMYMFCFRNRRVW